MLVLPQKRRVYLAVVDSTSEFRPTRLRETAPEPIDVGNEKLRIDISWFCVACRSLFTHLPCNARLWRRLFTYRTVSHLSFPMYQVLQFKFV